jgi:hypothetical protein
MLLRPSHLPVARFMGWLAPRSLATSDANSNSELTPSKGDHDRRRRLVEERAGAVGRAASG